MTSEQEAYARQAAAADRAVTEALAQVGVQHPMAMPQEEFVSATLSGIVMALVRYNAEAGRHMGYRVTARTIIQQLTPCLHASAEAVAPPEKGAAAAKLARVGRQTIRPS